MSTALPVLFHWSPAERRVKITRNGLRPSTPTLVETFAGAQGPRSLERSEGFTTAKAVCLGTTPSHAWSLCGAIWGHKDEVWDLWQVTLDTDDKTRIMENPYSGYRLGEIRVLNHIPKSRIWHVGTRTVGSRRWSHA